MSCGEKGAEKQWSCGKAGAVKVGSMVRDMGDPCLSQSPIKVVITGVDPSIRAEIWEFLLGCCKLGRTAEYRRQLRTARRERYEDLVKQCQTMHSSINHCPGMPPLLVEDQVKSKLLNGFGLCIGWRDSFQIEGPTGVMKKLQALWHILAFTDKEMFPHLSRIGAGSFHFAFRMLMVLFRREMMWAADFDESVARDLAENCLQPLMLEVPKDLVTDMGEESIENVDPGLKDGSQGRNENVEHSTCDTIGIKPASTYPFCGLTRNFWSRSDRMPIGTIVSSTKNGDELPVLCGSDSYNEPAQNYTGDLIS